MFSLGYSNGATLVGRDRPIRDGGVWADESSEAGTMVLPAWSHNNGVLSQLFEGR